MHPLEFALGEYNHLLALHAVARLLPALGLPPLHAAAAAFFVIVGGILAASARRRAPSHPHLLRALFAHIPPCLLLTTSPLPLIPP